MTMRCLDQIIPAKGSSTAYSRFLSLYSVFYSEEGLHTKNVSIITCYFSSAYHIQSIFCSANSSYMVEYPALSS